jgi:hypothetical protein
VSTLFNWRAKSLKSPGHDRDLVEDRKIYGKSSSSIPSVVCALEVTGWRISVTSRLATSTQMSACPTKFAAVNSGMSEQRCA